MSNQLLASKIVFEEEEPKVRAIVAGPSANLCAVGIAEKGPLGQQQVTSFEEYERLYGGVTANAVDLPMAIAGFFGNGGQVAYISRVVHYSDITNANSKTSAQGSTTFQTGALVAAAAKVLGSVVGPFALAAGDTFQVSRDATGTATATIAATAAALTAGSAGTYALSNNQTLLVAIDGAAAQTVTFLTASFVAIGAATALEVAAVINASIVGGKADVNTNAVRIKSDKLGTGSSVNVTGGTGAAPFTFGGIQSGTGNVANVLAVTVAEIKTIVEAAVSGVTVTNVGGAAQIASNTTGGSSSVQVLAASTGDTKLGFDNAVHVGTASGAQNTLQVLGKYDGLYANSLSVIIGAATSGQTDEFNVLVYASGVLVESWPNVTMNDFDTNYIVNVINDDETGSAFISVTDLAAALVTPDDRPANATQTLTGGGDGLAGITDTDFVGSPTSSTGIRAFDQLSNVRLLIVPGRATATVHNAMLTYCSTIRADDMFTILDPPSGLTAAQMINYVKATAILQNTVDSEFGAIYWPRIKVDNPDTSLFGNSRVVVAPPSGHLAGMYARTDASKPGGVYEAPAGNEVGQLIGMRGVETKEVNDERKRDLLYPELINPITAIDGQPAYVDGCRTLKSTGNFPTIGERRGIIYITTALRVGLQFAKFRKIKESTREQLERTGEAFMNTQTKNDAFASDIPAEAYFLDFGDMLNPASTAFQRKIVGRLGVATAKPAEFIVIKLSQDTRALDAELAALAA